jgi:hypothetical protein
LILMKSWMIQKSPFQVLVPGLSMAIYKTNMVAPTYSNTP